MSAERNLCLSQVHGDFLLSCHKCFVALPFSFTYILHQKLFGGYDLNKGQILYFSSVSPNDHNLVFALNQCFHGLFMCQHHIVLRTVTLEEVFTSSGVRPLVLFASSRSPRYSWAFEVPRAF